MNPIRRICRSAAIMAGLSVVLLTLGAVTPAAYALVVPAQGGPAGTGTVPSDVQTVVATGGMPGWQITLIAVGAAIVAAALAVLVYRALVAHRHVVVPSH